MAMMTFPSPYGDFVFQQARELLSYVVGQRFRPLTGILFFNLKEKERR